MKRFGFSIVAIVVAAGISAIATPAHALGGKRKGGSGPSTTVVYSYLPAPSQPSVLVVQPQYQPAPTMPTQYAGVTPASYSAPSPQITVSQPSVTRLPVGATLTLDAPGLGNNPGQVVLKMSNLSLPATVSSWKGDSVVVTLPNVGVTGSVASQLVILRADGSVASSAPVQLVAAQ